MKKSIVRILSVMLTCLLIFCTCSQEPSSADKIKFNSEIDVLLKNSKKTITNTYKSDFFREDARSFDKDLALLSYALAASTSGENAVQTLSTMSWLPSI